MSTEPLPILDILHMQVALLGLHVSRYPTPQYRVCFRICLHNAGDMSVRLRGRKWLLQSADGQSHIIEAAQVFNQYPVLTPGAVYSYSGSHCFSRLPLNMEVRFFGEDQWGSPFITPALIFPRNGFRNQRF